MTKAEKLIVRTFLKSEDKIKFIKGELLKGIFVEVSAQKLQGSLYVWNELNKRFKEFLKIASQKT